MLVYMIMWKASARLSRCRRVDADGCALGIFHANGRIEIPKRNPRLTKASDDKKEQRAREGAQAWAEYQAEARATQIKTARLRALRLARDAAANSADGKKGKK
jgi:hypothetical protein